MGVGDYLKIKYCNQVLLAGVKITSTKQEGFVATNNFSIHKSYCNEHMPQSRQDIQDGTGYCECDHVLNIPMCMIQGSLKDALKLVNGKEGNTIDAILIQHRIFVGIQECMD